MLVQEKLLRVIEYGQLERVGGSQPLRVDVRLVCATNDDLPALAAAGKFRADLLDRLAFDVVQLPPLRQRRPDIMLLAEHFAIQMCRELALPLFPGFTEHARRTLLEYGWPGNVRELKTWWSARFIATATATARWTTSSSTRLRHARPRRSRPFLKAPARYHRCRWI